MLIFPATALSLTVLAFNFLGDCLLDALDSGRSGNRAR
jgi:ABC-type dipeptide/oligopeptide/nickel transport system permease subunit